MNELKIFESEEFGAIREMTIDGEAWFVGNDVAISLGYARARDAVRKYVDKEDKQVASIWRYPGGTQDTTLINESGLYSLVMQSRLESAKRFKRWVTSEVLPAIRKNGGYGDMRAIVSECVQEVIKQIMPLLQGQQPGREALSETVRRNALMLPKGKQGQFKVLEFPDELFAEFLKHRFRDKYTYEELVAWTDSVGYKVSRGGIFRFFRSIKLVEERNGAMEVLTRHNEVVRICEDGRVERFMC